RCAHPAASAGRVDARGFQRAHDGLLDLTETAPLMRWLRQRSVLSWMDFFAVALVIVVTVWSMHPNLIFSSTLITGGDTGAHVVLPAFLRSQGDLTHLTPWYPGWF